MEVISEKHFKEMRLICGLFGERAISDSKYAPLLEASREINDMIVNIKKPEADDFNLVIDILSHADWAGDNSAVVWLDYKMHVFATLKKNGYE